VVGEILSKRPVPLGPSFPRFPLSLSYTLRKLRWLNHCGLADPLTPALSRSERATHIGSLTWVLHGSCLP
jgi:hypothetical protein